MKEYIFLYRGGDKQSRKRRKIYSLRRRIKTGKEKEGNIWRRKIFLQEETKNGEGRRGKQDKVNYAVSEKEVGCDNIDNDDKGERWSW